MDADNLWLLESVYRQYLENPASIDPSWRPILDEMRGSQSPRAPGEAPGTLFRPVSSLAPSTRSASGPKVDAVERLVDAYRTHGHRRARLHPLMPVAEQHPALTLNAYGLSSADLATVVDVPSLSGGAQTLQQIIDRLSAAYSQHIGVQFMHIEDADKRRWLQTRFETGLQPLRAEEQKRALEKITMAEGWETFAQTAFIGMKRFSLEGGETLIAMLDAAVLQAGSMGTREMVLAMPHRGRLSVLTHIAGKPAQMIFAEMADTATHPHGDEKYHLGYSCDYPTAGQPVHVSLCYNPSHLEFVGAVAQGRARARQDRQGAGSVLPVVLHGDAAFTGQGIVQEMFNMSELPGYRVGGTLHIVVNNQVGFTTSPGSARSNHYATDVARMLDIPVFHVNGDDPDAVIAVTRLALEYRQRFGQDVVIDLLCYRRRGHNEGDEPAFTQPLMYRWVAEQPSTRQLYQDRLVKAGVLAAADADAMVARCKEHLTEQLERAKQSKPLQQAPVTGPVAQAWSAYRGGADSGTPDVNTGVPQETLARLLVAQATWPETFNPHPKIVRLLGLRRDMAAGNKPLDWAAGEGLAMATLLSEGHPVRLSGQDSGRGTFSHRHAALHDVENGKLFVPLQHLQAGQAAFGVWDSPLSETGVLGFDYGYSLDYPEALVMWEAQYGDFGNGAQVIIDQFLGAAEPKWQRLSGIVLLLPHGYEGGGSEHSSARLERFLSLGADDVLQVVNLTTPAQLFHALRRQVHRPWRKPLVVMSPKSLLRHAGAVSPLGDFTQGGFQRVLVDAQVPAAKARRVVLCSGKIYYDLVAERQERGLSDVALIRLEQLYPLREADLLAALGGYAENKPVIWAQEEPHNMGAWPFLRYTFGDRLVGRWPLEVVARPAAARPATSSASHHKAEQTAVLHAALGL